MDIWLVDVGACVWFLSTFKFGDVMNKIDLIIDALENCKGLTQIDRAHLKKALAAARELKALKPVAWITNNYEQDRSATTFDVEMANRWRNKGWRIAPLYALDEVTK